MAGNGYENGWGGEPEYLAAPPHDPYRGDSPGHTRPFPVGGHGAGEPYGGPQGGYAQAGYPTEPDRGHPSPYRPEYPPGYSRPRGGEYPRGYGHEPTEPDGYAQDNIATYRAGGRTTPRATGPRLPWRPLLAGIFRNPTRTFDQMRDHQAWLPAITVSLVYGVLVVLGFSDTRSEVVNSTFPVAAWSLAGAAVGFTLTGLILGSVTYALARQLGGDGPWQSTVGLAVLIGWTTDAPRLLLALVLPSDGGLVQAVGWATWLFCGFLLTSMVRRVHDLPWGKAAGAAALQLVVLLVLIKLPTLG
ncbi:Yip1 family protein [Kitasatospora sp. NPDC052896]|uniref:Yip1 family protein n=1 Tax=Kitasatospora sp. NPDC052896 TaxID=3364061 RepID=UPI0037C9ACD6